MNETICVFVFQLKDESPLSQCTQLNCSFPYFRWCWTSHLSEPASFVAFVEIKLNHSPLTGLQWGQPLCSTNHRAMPCTWKRDACGRADHKEHQRVELRGLSLCNQLFPSHSLCSSNLGHWSPLISGAIEAETLTTARHFLEGRKHATPLGANVSAACAPGMVASTCAFSCSLDCT